MINNLIYGFFFHFLLQDVEVAHDKDVVVVTIHLKKARFYIRAFSSIRDTFNR